MLGDARADGDRGITPVVGIVMMVAVTIVLSAVVASFVLSLNNSTDGPPDADLSWSAYGGSDAHFNLSHTGGESLAVEEYTIEVETSSGTKQFALATAQVGGGERFQPGDIARVDVDVSSPTGAEIAAPLADVTEIRLLWHAPDSGQTRLMATWTP